MFSTGKKPIQNELTEADIKNINQSMRLRNEVGNIDIPIVQETETEKLQ
jgi:hypothetical protein